MNKNEQLLGIVKDYAERIALVSNDVDYRVRYDTNSNDGIAVGIRDYYQEVSRVLQSS